jgi:phage-related protein
MATTTKALGRGAFATSSATLYTVPAATTTVVSNIVITNTASSAGTFTLGLNGTSLATTVAVAANSITTIDLKQVLSATHTITGLASATTINYHISGVEIS